MKNKIVVCCYKWQYLHGCDVEAPSSKLSSYYQLKWPIMVLLMPLMLLITLFSQQLYANEKPAGEVETVPRQLAGVVVDHLSREGVVGTTVVLSVNGDTLEQRVVKENGEFAFDFDYKANVAYQLAAEKDGYLSESIDLSLTLKKNRLPKRIEVSLAKQDIFFNFRGNILNRETKKPVSDLRIMLVNTRSGEMTQLMSDHRGEYAFKVVSGYEYEIIFDRLNYLTRFAYINYCSDALEKNQKYCFSGFARPALDPEGGMTSANVFVDEAEIGKKFAIKDIHYNYNDVSLREDALPNLRKLYHTLQDNPQLIVELGSHTDSRGSDNYNFELSQQRADAAVNYMIELGIAADRIAAKGYGEVALLNHCENGVKCSDSEHAQNRRTEFIIIGIDESAYVE